MPKNQDTLFRQWHMLRYVPRHPWKITVQAIHHRLAIDGFATTERTVQRDLQELSRLFPLVVDESNKPFGWSWDKEAKAFDLPGLSVAEALTWVMAEQQLGQLLPGSMLDVLAPHFRVAHERLDMEQQPQHGRKWLDKVRVVQPTQPLLPPDIDPEVQRIISDAVFQERQVEIRYRRKVQEEATAYRVHPLAIVQRGHVVYLYGRLFDYPNTRILAMHRVEAATLLDAPAVPPQDFNLEDKVARGVWSFGSEENLEIRLRFYNGAGEHLLETPLAADQRTRAIADSPGTLIVSATVIDNPQLRWWLLGFGDGVEVLAPALLRQQMSEAASKLCARYTGAPDQNPLGS